MIKNRVGYEVPNNLSKFVFLHPKVTLADMSEAGCEVQYVEEQNRRKEYSSIKFK